MNFSQFLQSSFEIVNPGIKYQHNWHIDLIAEALEEATRGNIKRLIINIPPRSLKSMCISVAWPAWLLACNPSARIMCASYSQILSKKHSTDCRLLVTSKWYKEKFPNVEITFDQNEKSKFTTTERGFRFATSIGGTATGEGGNYLIVDDPHNPLQAASPTQRKKAIEWFEQTFVSRLDDKKKGIIVIVMQRLHEEDLTGYLLKKASKLWYHLKIPALAEETEIYNIGNIKYERKAGELLHNERDGLAELDQTRTELGDYAFSAQYQQSPIPKIGNLLKREWLKYYDNIPDEHRIIHSWDTAIKASVNNDYSVCTIWAETSLGFYLIEVIKEKYEYPNLKKNVINIANKWHPHAILIEDKASGQSLIQDIRNETSLPIIAIKPIQDKVTRFARVTSFFEAERVFLPGSATWKAEYINELLSFPTSTYDDQVDSTSQFLNWIISNKNFKRVRDI
ncbi:MAG: phage terminase large subunit [Alphaproteobacteria bacterium]